MLLLAVLLALLAGGSDARAAWLWPVRGQVITPFAVGANPFAPGQHRGIDVAAAAGAPVRAPCAGTVRFAGRVPGRGRGVTIVCGRLVATVLELGTTRVRRGEPVAPGATIGAAAASHVQLGARRLGAKHGYIDPRPLLGESSAAPPPPVPPWPRSPLGPRAGPAPALAASVPAPSRALRAGPATASGAAAATHLSVPPVGAPAAPVAPAAAASRGLPPAAWAGLVLLAAGTPLGALVRRRRRAAGRTSDGPAGVQVGRVVR